jgi:predicted NAD-dependent protein-ADP-ribosyltransferase YbiA (DUF1768 family)
MKAFFVQKDHWLNNNYPSPIRYEGLIFPTVWHAYLAAKTSDTNIKREIAATSVGGSFSHVATRVVQQIGFHGPETMEKLLNIKFGLTVQDLNITAQMHLAKQLVGTGLQILEHGNHGCDIDWGMCYCSRHTINSDLEPIRATGQNQLGKLLMKIRDNWRLYIEAVNAIGSTCVLCSKPAKLNVLYTQAKDPSFPLILESCFECQAQIFLKASHASSDKLIIRYDPFEKQEVRNEKEPWLVREDVIKETEEPVQSNMLSIIKRICPHCTQFVPVAAPFCPFCYKSISTMGHPTNNYVNNYQSPLPPDREYTTEDFTP